MLIRSVYIFEALKLSVTPVISVRCYNELILLVFQCWLGSSATWSSVPTEQLHDRVWIRPQRRPRQWWSSPLEVQEEEDDVREQISSCLLMFSVLSWRYLASYRSARRRRWRQRADLKLPPYALCFCHVGILPSLFCSHYVVTFRDRPVRGGLFVLSSYRFTYVPENFLILTSDKM